MSISRMAGQPKNHTVKTQKACDIAKPVPKRSPQVSRKTEQTEEKHKCQTKGESSWAASVHAEQRAKTTPKK